MRRLLPLFLLLTVVVVGVLLFVTLTGNPFSVTRMFGLRGRVLAVDLLRREVLLQHDSIPGFMPPMTMAFQVRTMAGLFRVHPGDSISAALQVSRDESWISALKVLHHGTSHVVTVAPRPADADTLPDVPLMDAQGRAFHTRDLRGRAVVLGFFYSRCPLPDACPRQASSLAAAQRELERDPALSGRFHILTPSLDLGGDSLPELARYGMRYGVAPKLWTLARADTLALLTLLDAAQVTVRVEPKSILHEQSILIYRPDGTLSNRLMGTRWTTADLRSELLRALGVRHQLPE